MTRRRLRSVAPIAPSMPRARSRRWAITEKLATDTRPMNARPSTSTTRMSTAGEYPAHLLRGNRHSCRRDTGHRLVAAELLCRGRAEQHDHLAGMPELARGDQRELVRQVARVLHNAGHPPGRAGRVPGAARVRAVQGRDLAGQRDLAGADRERSADQAEQRRIVVPVRALGPQLHRLPGGSRDVLLLDEIGRPPAAGDGGDVGGQPRIGAGQRDLRGAGAEGGVARRDLRVGDDAGAPDGRRDRHGEQAEHEQLLAPFATEQPPAPADHRPAGDDAAAGVGVQVRGFAQRGAH